MSRWQLGLAGVMGVAMAALAAVAHPGPSSAAGASSSVSARASTSAHASASAQCMPAPAPLPAARYEPAVAQIAGQLHEGLPATEGRVIVALAPLWSDTTVNRGDELVKLIGNLLAGKRGWIAPDRIEPVEEALVRTRKAAYVAYVRVRLEQGRLRATADLHPVPATIWARAKNPAPGAVAHAFAEAPIDAEIRTFLPPIPLVGKLDLARGRALENDVLAIACDDLDRDGEPELVTVSTDQVVISRLRDGKVQAAHSRLWTDLSDMDPTPLREPIANVFAISPGARAGAPGLHVVVSSTDRRKSVELDERLQIARVFPAFAIPEGGGYACARLQALSITGPLQQCAEGTPEPTRPSVTGQFDAYASARLVDPAGKAFDVWAGRESGRIEARDSEGGFARIASGGAQLAIGDLDLDGKPEILSSLDVNLGTPDAVVVYTWDRALKLPPREQLRIPIASGVRAIAVCPANGASRLPIAIATTDEIIVAR